MTTRISATARTWIVLIIVLAPALTAGCSGDDAAATGASATTGSSTGGSASAATTSSGTSTTATASSGSGGAPPTTPALSVVFPPSGATAEESIVVRGTSSYEGTVSSVTVNDTPATSSDGFASWHAEIQLADGDNSIDVRMKNDMGEELAAPVTVVVHRFPDDASVARGAGFEWAGTNLRGMDVDPEGKFVVIADSNFDGLFGIDLTTGDRSWATCSESTPACEGGGDGFAMVDPTDVALVGSAGQAVVPDGDVIVAVDLATKNRSVVSDSTKGSGPAFARAGSLVPGASSDAALVLDWDAQALVSVDLTTGDRTVVADANKGGGGSFSNFFHLAADIPGGRAFLTKAYVDAVFAIDLASGDRSEISSESIGMGPALTEPSDVCVPSGGTEAFTLSGDQILAIDLATGDRRVASSDSVGKGPPLGAVQAIAFGHGLLWARTDTPAIVAIDPVEGHRVVVAK